MFEQITVVGYLGKDPEMKFTQQGKAMTYFSVATSRSYTKGNGEKVEETHWFNVTVFDRQAEACNQYLSKGDPVLVVGTLRADLETGGPRTFQRNNGTMGASFEINALTVRFLPSGNGGAGGSRDEDYSPF